MLALIAGNESLKAAAQAREQHCGDLYATICKGTVACSGLICARTHVCLVHHDAQILLCTAWRSAITSRISA